MNKAKIWNLAYWAPCTPIYTLPHPSVSAPLPSKAAPPFCYLRCFKSDFDTGKSKVGVIHEYMKIRFPITVPNVFPDCSRIFLCLPRVKIFQVSQYTEQTYFQNVPESSVHFITCWEWTLFLSKKRPRWQERHVFINKDYLRISWGMVNNISISIRKKTIPFRLLGKD